MVIIQRCHLRCLASRAVSIVFVFYCLQVVVVALIVDWDGLTVWCDVYWLFHGWHYLSKGCWNLCGAYDLLNTRVYLLCLWVFWIGILAWWLCLTCWRNPTVWLLLCRWVICFLLIDRNFFLLTSWSLAFLSRFVFFFWRCVLSNLACNRSVVLGIILLLFGVW